ncbi:3-oxo-5-alpha-steroid 4-dehydrogenase 2 isoform X2 [Taeniopygia guttata]|uniref:3-oxo-5-alpha-steroid 4-dehydrogenase 2 isoform X2 n=1 Tax=Taeniopygia guttata TaxID=59729 RepID=UPI0011AEFF91|nr:3-oxo-5-alpha-steroid 4-dehydrogenase 2 isoform X2 [Taeniopygia guttata]
MQCLPGLVLALSSLLGALALLQLSLHLRVPSRYGKHEERPCPPRGRLPARCAWFLQELPSFLVPALLLALRSPPRLEPLGCRLLCCLFCWHYFYRYIGSACCGQEKRRVCGAGSSGGRRTQSRGNARGWPGANSRSAGSAGLCPPRGASTALRPGGAAAPKLLLCARFVIPAPLPKYQFMLGFFFLFIYFLFRNLIFSESTNAVTLINSVFTDQELNK